jgi:hypothetical protein
MMAYPRVRSARVASLPRNMLHDIIISPKYMRTHQLQPIEARTFTVWDAAACVVLNERKLIRSVHVFVPLSVSVTMRKLALVGALLVVGAAHSAKAQPVNVGAPAAGATVIDFNSLTAGTSITNQYSGLGVTVSSSCFMANNAYSSYFGGDPMQATNFDLNGADCANGTAYPNVTFTFSTTQSYFGLMGLSNGNIYLTDANGTVSGNTNIGSVGAQFVGFTDAAGFTSVTLTADGNNAFAVDDVSFTTSAPEPSSAALFATGIFAMGAAVRRKRKTS